MKRKLGLIGIIQLACLILGCLVSTTILISQDGFNFISFLQWSLFLYVVLSLLANVILSHKVAQGRAQEIVF